MKRFLLILLMILLTTNVAYSACTGSSPTWTSTPDYASVSSCVSKASSGDTISVLSGSATWNATLLITKIVKLQGAGAGGTIITSNLPSTGGFLIIYNPADGSADYLFEITGFTFEMGSSSNYGLMIGGIAPVDYRSSSVEFAKTRIHHNVFNKTGAYTPLYFVGNFKSAVVDNNTFNGRLGFQVIGGDKKAWENSSIAPHAHGSGKGIYFEDNVYNHNLANDVINDGARGSRWVQRYNTIVLTSNPGAVPSMWDMHGDQASASGSIAGEIYGNKIVDTQKNPQMLDQRGGKVVAFYNYSTSTRADSNAYYAVRTRNEYPETTYPLTSEQPQHVSDSYYWSNYNTSKFLLSHLNYDSYYEIVENSQFWTMRATGSFDGTGSSTAGGGVGCGTLATLQGAAYYTECTAGVGYWATDQSCADLTGLVGANPATPISGTLYKCNATGDGWDSYYTLYDYPHPLRGESETTHTVTVSKVGNGATLSADGDRVVYDGNQINVVATRHNGWNGAWSGTCPNVASCTVPDEGKTAVCSVTPTENCTATFTATSIPIL
jgi:hypothetical protein